MSRSIAVPLFVDDSEIETKIVHDDDDKIVGGHATTIEEHPYQASIQLVGIHRCGGAIISATRILTTAHCIDVEHVPEDYVVMVGSTNRINAKAQLRVVSNYVRHPKYNAIILLNDVAVLKLKTKLEFGLGVRAIALQPQGAPTADGAIASVTGWGRTHEHSKSLSSVLQVASVAVVSNERCNKIHKKQISSDMLCAGVSKGVGDSCFGDNGGPLVINGILHGIVSWGKHCGKPYIPRVYVRVSFFTNWIKKL